MKHSKPSRTNLKAGDVENSSTKKGTKNKPQTREEQFAEFCLKPNSTDVPQFLRDLWSPEAAYHEDELD